MNKAQIYASLDGAFNDSWEQKVALRARVLGLSAFENESLLSLLKAQALSARLNQNEALALKNFMQGFGAIISKAQLSS